MSEQVKILFFLIFILTIIGCKKAEEEEQYTQKKFGRWYQKNDSLGVELELKKLKTWKDLIYQTEIIACNDSVPKLTITSDKNIKTIYFNNPCWENFACILIRQKNTIEIHNDTINKNNENFYPLDSLDLVLKRDLENYGKNPKLSDTPEKLLFYVSYTESNFDNLPETLDKLTQAYERITNKTNINIWLNQKIKLLPPPPPIPKTEL